VRHSWLQPNGSIILITDAGVFAVGILDLGQPFGGIVGVGDDVVGRAAVDREPFLGGFVVVGVVGVLISPAVAVGLARQVVHHVVGIRRVMVPGGASKFELRPSVPRGWVTVLGTVRTGQAIAPCRASPNPRS
jgi:hypothetical protein